MSILDILLHLLISWKALITILTCLLHAEHVITSFHGQKLIVAVLLFSNVSSLLTLPILPLAEVVGVWVAGTECSACLTTICRKDTLIHIIHLIALLSAIRFVLLRKLSHLRCLFTIR